MKTKIRNGASDEDIKRKLLDFAKTKPESRDSSNKYGIYSDLKIPDYMNQIGG